jgi:hypothetical protein
MPNFEEERSKVHNLWFSPSKRTFPGGYKFQIAIHPNGVGEGAGTHLSISLRPIKTLLDGDLKWPAKCLMTLQLMNQFHDQDHLTISETMIWDTPSHIVNVRHQFVKHEDLEWNVKRQTHYLCEDTLQFRILKVNVLSL